MSQHANHMVLVHVGTEKCSHVLGEKAKIVGTQGQHRVLEHFSNVFCRDCSTFVVIVGSQGLVEWGIVLP